MTTFLLSPANLNGKRAERLVSGASTHPLALELQGPAGAPLGKLFTFISSLYFRGKLTYAEHFGNPGSTWVITAASGLQPPDRRLTLADIEAERQIPIDPRHAKYRDPLEADARRLAEALGKRDRVVLLGSLATGKYLDVLEPIFGTELLAPEGFRRLGEMQRGSRLLKAVAADKELDYEPCR